MLGDSSLTSLPGGDSAPKLILVIVADQLRADHVGFGGLDFGHTPHLDALAATGTVFDRAHVTNPLCMPSRASLATGRWPSVHGTRTNGIPLDPTAETAMRSLRRAGWFTAAIGKLHLQTMGWDAEDFQLAEIAATNPQTNDGALLDARGSELGHRYDWEYLARHRGERVEMPDDYYGFASTELVVGHGDRASGHYHHWVRDQGFDPGPVGGHDASARPGETWNEVWQSAVPLEFSTSRYVAERTVAQIEAAAMRPGPTFLFASFPDPHHPFCPPASHADRVDPRDIELPATFHQSPEGLPPHLRHMLAQRGVPHADAMCAFAATEAQYREALIAEVGLIAMIDEAVGEMMAAIERAGLADQTSVIFTADHGDLFGDHGLVLKHHVHYRSATRVPLVIAGAGSQPQRSDALVSNADVVPTILDLAAVQPFRGIQGRSVQPILAGEIATHRDAVLVEEDQPFGVDGLQAPVRMRTLITDEGRMTRYHGESFGELYLSTDDPDEEHNRFADPTVDAVERGFRDRLFDEMLTLADEGARMFHGA